MLLWQKNRKRAARVECTRRVHKQNIQSDIVNEKQSIFANKYTAQANRFHYGR